MRSYIIESGRLVTYKGKAAHATIPNGVTSIGNYAFFDNKNLTSIKIPNSVATIGYSAFNLCINLESIVIPNNVTEIFTGAFNQVKDVKPQYNPNGTLRAYKAFFKDWTCKDFKYELGKSFHIDGEIICCERGFHACVNPLDIFNYYYGKLSSLHFAEVELSGTMDWDGEKIAASDIKIVRELTASELAEIYNSMEKV